MITTASFSGEAWHHASLPSTRRHSMRLPVNVARGFTPVSEVDMEDDWRPSTGMTSTASFSGEAWHHTSLPPTRRHSMRLSINAARGTHAGA
jgi:hypothetical protein